MRTRNIKPGFFKNDILGSLPPLCRILFSGLWCLADREGRLEDRPLRIKAEILPFDDCNADELLAVLDENGFIKRYRVGNDKFIEITKFYLHQHPHVKEGESVIPSPEAAKAAREVGEEYSPKYYEKADKKVGAGTGKVSDTDATEADSTEGVMTAGKEAVEECGKGVGETSGIKESQNRGKTGVLPTEETKHRESTGQAPTQEMSSPSLNLKPYTLNPIPSTLKRNSSARGAEKREEEAQGVLNHFEKKTGICYRDKKSRLYPIKVTLSKGFTKEELNSVTDKMCSEWKGTKYEKLLTPSILFGERFEEYLNRSPYSAIAVRDKGSPFSLGENSKAGSRFRFNDYENKNTYTELDIERLMKKSMERLS